MPSASTIDWIQFIKREGMCHVVVVPPVEHFLCVFQEFQPLLLREWSVHEIGEWCGVGNVLIKVWGVSLEVRKKEEQVGDNVPQKVSSSGHYPEPVEDSPPGRVHQLPNSHRYGGPDQNRLALTGEISL